LIRGIHHATVSTGDLDRALRFYRDLLGLEVVHSISWERGEPVADRLTRLKDSAATLVMLRAGNAFVELVHYESPYPRGGDPERPVCDHGITHICFDVVDVDQEYQRLKAAGVEFHCSPKTIDNGRIRTTYGRDPDGNVLEFQQIQEPDSAIALRGLGDPGAS